MKLRLTSHPFADWFFPNTSVRIIRLFRLSLGVVTFATVVSWLPHVRAFFTNAGWVTGEYVQATTPHADVSIFFWNDSPGFVYAMFALLVLSTLGLIFGKGGRWSAFIAWFLFLSLVNRFPLVNYGGIDILHMLLFFNMFHPSIGYRPWSSGGLEERNKAVPAWSMRMVMISVCIVYLFAAVYKIRSDTWLNGTEIMNSLSTRFGAADFAWLASYPIVLNILSYFSWFVELAFPFLVWNKSLHRAMLLAIAGLHLGVRVMINATLFSEIMLVSLLTFITPEDEARIGELWDKYTKRLRTGWQRSRAARNKTKAA
jgi:hypothetical protein